MPLATSPDSRAYLVGLAKSWPGLQVTLVAVRSGGLTIDSLEAKYVSCRETYRNPLMKPTRMLSTIVMAKNPKQKIMKPTSIPASSPCLIMKR